MADLEETIVKCDPPNRFFTLRCGEWKGKLKDAIRRENRLMSGSLIDGKLVDDEGKTTVVSYYCPKCKKPLMYLDYEEIV